MKTRNVQYGNNKEFENTEKKFSKKWICEHKGKPFILNLYYFIVIV